MTQQGSIVQGKLTLTSVGPDVESATDVINEAIKSLEFQLVEKREVPSTRFPKASVTMTFKTRPKGEEE